jgi:RHS repeat-associated protein
VSLGFAGGLFDVATGLVRFGTRDYGPVLARWTSKDIQGLRGRPNAYEYAHSAPHQLIDPNGLDVRVSLYQGAGGYGHVAIGIGVGSTIGFYPVSGYEAPSVLGAVPGQFMVDDPSLRIGTLVIKTSPEQDCAMRAAMGKMMHGPRTYSLVGGSCVDFVANVLGAGGIDVPVRRDAGLGIWDVTTIPNDYFAMLADMIISSSSNGRIP